MEILPNDMEGLRGRLLSLILGAQRVEAASLLEDAAAQLGNARTIGEILEPTLRLIGESWSNRDFSLAQAYVAGKVAEDYLEGLAAKHLRPLALSGSEGGIAVLGNAEDDFHGLGRRMVSAFLRVAGWEVIDLGNDVLAEHIVQEAVAARAQVIGVSAMMLTNAKNILKVRKELEVRGLSGRIKLAVGGAVFAMRPELVEEVGGDGSSATAMEAPLLFSRLRASLEPGK
jgi:methylmalonyl-CoA mutase cobalamin-binding domain/chain